MFTEDLFELFSEYESLPETQKPAFLAELKAQYPDKAEQLKLLTQDSNDFTEHFLENISSYSENMAIPSISEGDNFGVYTIVKPIGSGGMGQVYLAKRNDGLIEQQVAIKFLHPALYQLNSTQTLLNEAQALASLNHPNIATVLDVVKMPDGIIYMVMEYIEGCTLTEYLAKNNLSVKEKLNLFLTIADAVQEAHSQRIIHADIKASNILINHKNHPQLIDFGIMQFVGSKEEKSNTFINQYLCAMTVNYAAPEQLQGQPASIHSDVYALGGLLYFILSGQTPFEEVGGTLPDKIKAITEQEIPPCKISQKLKFRQDINWVLSTCLAKQPEQRFRSVEALYLELSYYQNNQPLSTKNSLFYKLVKSWQRHKVTYVLSLSVVILIITFTSKVWYDNIKIKQSYQELTRSYINQYTTLQEITNQSDVIELPSSESIPLNLYIKLAFQKYDLEVGSSAVNGLQTMNQLKLLLLENKFSDDKTLHLVEYRAFLVKNKVINSDEMIKAFRRSFNDILVRNDLTPEERINIIFVTMNLGKLHYVKIKLKKELEQLDKTLIVEALSPSESIKYNLIKAFYFSDIATNISINPTNFSQKALAIAEKHSDEIPSELYLVTLYLNVKTIEKYQGFSIDYFKMVQKSHIYLSKVNFSVDNNGVMNLYSRINQTLLFDQFKSFPFTNIENSKLKEDKTSSIREAQYLFITGQYEPVSYTHLTLPTTPYV